jgi:hypothetical protein
MKKTLLTIVIITACLITKTYAQDGGGMKAWQDYMTPGDVHKMMAKDTGDWKEDVTFWMKPGDAPNTSTATAHTEMMMGGRYQQTKINGDMMGMPFEGFSLLGYDNAKKIFTSTWMDNFGTGTTTLTGPWDAASKSIMLSGTEFDPMSGKDIAVKETMQFIDDNTQKIQMFINSGKGDFKSMEINITRSK